MSYNEIHQYNSNSVTVYRFDYGYIIRIFINDRAENTADFSIISWENPDLFSVDNSTNGCDKSNSLYLFPSRGDYVVYRGIKYIGKEDLYKLQQVVEQENIKAMLDKIEEIQ